jgi:hypothetical protein
MTALAYNCWLSAPLLLLSGNQLSADFRLTTMTSAPLCGLATVSVNQGASVVSLVRALCHCG